MRLSNRPIVWTIAGSDSGGGAGIQADLITFHDFAVHGCSVITALTAQNSVGVDKVIPTSADDLIAQIQALQQDLPAAAIKIGMLGSQQATAELAEFLANYHGKVIVDPVMVASSGSQLSDSHTREILITQMLPRADLLTPNLSEVELILGHAIDDIAQAATELLALGCKAVLIKGGHADGELASDYYCDAHQSFWLSQTRYQHHNTHGSGCTLSAAICACLALGYSMPEALVLAKSYLSQGIRHAVAIGAGPGPVKHAGWPNASDCFCWIGQQRLAASPDLLCQIGNYPLVNTIDQLQTMISDGFNSIQWREKTADTTLLEQAITIGKQHNIQLFINDDWQTAIKLNAFGVHLGQQDLISADISAIKQAGLRLGISCHNYFELAKAHYVNPSYIAIGPIFKTNSKDMQYPSIGLQRLRDMRQLVHYPLVAIGGIQTQHLQDLHQCGVDGIAGISMFTKQMIHA